MPVSMPRAEIARKSEFLGTLRKKVASRTRALATPETQGLMRTTDPFADVLLFET